MKNTRPQIGWLCAFAPEEIALAAGLLLMRLSGKNALLAGKFH
jgi:hypothetical protein